MSLMERLQNDQHADDHDREGVDHHVDIHASASLAPDQGDPQGGGDRGVAREPEDVRDADVGDLPGALEEEPDQLGRHGRREAGRDQVRDQALPAWCPQRADVGRDARDDLHPEVDEVGRVHQVGDGSEQHRGGDSPAGDRPHRTHGERVRRSRDLVPDCAFSCHDLLAPILRGAPPASPRSPSSPAPPRRWPHRRPSAPPWRRRRRASSRSRSTSRWATPGRPTWSSPTRTAPRTPPTRRSTAPSRTATTPSWWPPSSASPCTGTPPAGRPRPTTSTHRRTCPWAARTLRSSTGSPAPPTWSPWASAATTPASPARAWTASTRSRSPTRCRRAPSRRSRTTRSR